MRKLKLYLTFTILFSLTNCEIKNENVNASEFFYKNFKEAFIKSDLVKYNYDPRLNFSYGKDSSTYFIVLVLQDSSIRIFRAQNFNKLFRITNDIIFEDIIDVTRLENNFQITYPRNAELSLKEVQFDESKINVVDYFVNLKKQIKKYRIKEIRIHRLFNTVRIGFSDLDYFIYKPDSLIVNDSNKRFLKTLFKNGEEVDKNWYRFTNEKTTDYH